MCFLTVNFISPGSNDNDDHIALAMEWLNHGKSFRILRYNVFIEYIIGNKFLQFRSVIINWGWN